MAIQNSNIEWTGATFNPWQGCSKKTITIADQVKLREECRNCYMYRDKKRYGQQPQIVVRSKPPTFNKPLKIQKEVDRGQREKNSIDTLIFTCSWSDYFNPEADDWRLDAWQIMRRTPDLTYQILTKLPHRIGDHLPSFWDEIRGRVWLGYSCGMPGAEPMIGDLYGHGAAVLFLSCEPLLGKVDIQPYLMSDAERIDWMIGGGESGPKARPTNINWARHLEYICEDNHIPFFWKQWGEWRPTMANVANLLDDNWFQFPGEPTLYHKVGKKKAGRVLDGREWAEFPVMESGKENLAQARLFV